MPIPWLRLIDGVLGATDIARFVRGRAASSDPPSSGPFEQRVAGLLVGALREAFDRDRERVDVERQRLDEERMRAERALRLELLRQAGDREIGRLRLLSAVALVSLLGSLFLVTRVVAPGAGARVSLGIGWLLLIAALAAAFSAQTRVARLLAREDDRSFADAVTTSPAGAAAPWLIVAGLAAIGLAVLVA